jgi:hypothetical protein
VLKILSRLAEVREIVGLCIAKSRQGGLPASRQLIEMVILKLWRDLGPNYYLLARFWRPELRWRDKSAHLNVRQYGRLVNRMNPEAYRKISQHKVVEKSMLTLLGSPTPRFVGFWHKDDGRTAAGGPLRCARDLKRLLAHDRVRKICFKPPEGWGGRGFMAAEVERIHDNISLRLHAGRFRTTVESIESMAERLDLPGGYLIEEYLEQHSVLMGLNPSSVNTLRLWVIREGASFRLTGAFLKVGRPGSLVDNLSAGGLLCGLDLADGRVTDVRDSTIQASTYVNHPDTGASIVGVVVPFWHDCCRLAGDALRAFPHMNFSSPDVAVAQDGPRIIELNMEPDRTLQCDFDRPAKALLALE